MRPKTLENYKKTQLAIDSGMTVGEALKQFKVSSAGYYKWKNSSKGPKTSATKAAKKAKRKYTKKAFVQDFPIEEVKPQPEIKMFYFVGSFEDMTKFIKGLK